MSVYCPVAGRDVTYMYCAECAEKWCRKMDSVFAILVAGTRTYNDYAMFRSVMDTVLRSQVLNGKNIFIVSGGASGADKMAKRYAMERNFLYHEEPYRTMSGRAGGYVRNRKMHEIISRFPKRGVMLFWDGISKGTSHSFALSKEFGNPLRCYLYKERRYIKQNSSEIIHPP